MSWCLLCLRYPHPLCFSVYVLDNDREIPPTMMSLARLVGLSQEEWVKTQGKGKPPKAKMDSDMGACLKEVLNRRLSQYPTSEEVSVCYVALLCAHQKIP